MPRVDLAGDFYFRIVARRGPSDDGVVNRGTARKTSGANCGGERDDLGEHAGRGTSVTLQFDLNRNIDGAARDVQAAISAAANDLPLDLPGPPTYRKVNPADAPIMIMSMTSDTLPLAQVFEYANDIVAQKLSQIEGVSQAVSGRRREIGGARADQSGGAGVNGAGAGGCAQHAGAGERGFAEGQRGQRPFVYAISANDQLTNVDGLSIVVDDAIQQCVHPN